MDETSTNLTLPYLQAAQAQKHVTHNAALERLDLIVQLVLQSFAETSPPAAPAEGQVWAVGAGATGAWSGEDGALAAWSNGGWLFVAPKPGWSGVVATELRLWTGSAWVAPDLPALQNLPGVGIGTSHDATNRLAVAAEAVLLTHAGAGHQLKVNKNAAADTASLLFQTGWSARAEMGTLGSDAFGVKVSADGSSWNTTLSVDAATGVPTLGQGAVVSGSITGTAVVQSPTDVTSGRLLTTAAGPDQAFRRGTILGTVSQASGVPTGALIERGSNANGEYVRFADGTQICWAGILAVTDTEDLTWTFPAAFAYPASPGRPAISGWVPATIGAPRILQIGGLTSGSSVAVRVLSTAWARVAANVHLMAVGRWF